MSLIVRLRKLRSPLVGWALGCAMIFTLQSVEAQQPPARSLFTPNTPPVRGKRPAYRNPMAMPFSSATERSRENPVRFVFAQRTDPSGPIAAGADPSAGAIWSTLLTGDLSPEIVEWHLQQRRVEQQHRAAQQAGADVAPQGPASAALAKSFGPSRSGAGPMERPAPGRRLGFSLAAGSPPPVRPQGEPAPPGTGSIWLELLTGYRNNDRLGWKNEQVEYLASLDRTPSDVRPDLFDRNPYQGVPTPYYYAAARATQQEGIPRQGEGVPAPYYYATAPTAYPRPVYPSPIHPTPAQSAPYAPYGGMPNRTDSDYAAAHQQPIPTPLTADRFIDDGFAMNTPPNLSGSIRPVSAEVQTLPPPATPPTRLNVYRPHESPGTPPEPLRPEPLRVVPNSKPTQGGLSGTSDGWQPVEAK